MSEPLLQVRDVTVSLRGCKSAALDRISFDLCAGQVLAVLGESGAGKTTLARTIVKLSPLVDASIEGKILFKGIDLLATSEHMLQSIRGAGISLIPQEPELGLNPVMRVRDQVEEVLRAHSDLSRRERGERVESTLAAAGFPTELSFHYPHQLSGGQRQRIVIAQALVCQPALLIADEPTSALDNVLQAEILSLLRELIRRFNLALVFITHDAALLDGLADGVLLMRAGRIFESGSFQAVRNRPKDPYTAELIGSSLPFLRTNGEQERDRTRKAWVSDRCAIHRPTTPKEDDVASEGRPVLEMSCVTKTYSGRRRRFLNASRVIALKDVTVSVAPCSTLAIVGKSGAGKSTLGRCMALLERPDSGDIRFNGNSLASLSSSDLRLVRSKIQLVWQHSALALNPRFRAIDIVAEPLRILNSASKADSHERALAMMLKLGLPASLAGRTSLELSGGQRQRLALARALILSPSILILDEAFAGLDVPLEREITATLLELKLSLSLSYVFITHDLRRAASFADRIAVMLDGEIVEFAGSQTLLSRPKHKTTQELVSAMPDLQQRQARL